jgi:competence protein ComEA
MSRSIFEGRPAGRGVGLRGLLAGLALSLLLAASAAQAGEPIRLDLNQATAAELEALPGIGAVKAAAIVAERESSGGFRSIDELESVRGIGPSLVAKLRPHVTLGSSSKSGPKSGSKASGAAGR